MVTDQKDVQRRTIMTLSEELLADVTLANNLLLELNRYLDQLKNRDLEMLRLEVLGDHPLIKFDVTTDTTRFGLYRIVAQFQACSRREELEIF
ncbi:hypothetical protein Tco_0237944 [Tanacetum coccineum]